MPQRKAPAVAPTPSAPREPVAPVEAQRTSLFDPELRQQLMRDPVAQAITGAWRRRDQHGRVAYEQMVAHGAVAGPFRVLLAILKTVRVDFVAPQAEPTHTQREMAEFLNAQLQRLPWTKIVDGWFGQGYQFGFSLAEMSTRVEPWRKRPFVQVAELSPLPQASLDDGFSFHGSFAGATVSAFRPTYTCFDFDERGRPKAYYQYRLHADDGSAIAWRGADALHILHFKSGGGDGNPFGESLLHPAFDHWADLYLLERLEQLFLENATPYLTASYEGDDPKPALHQAISTHVSEQDPTRRVLVGNNITFGKVTASDPDFSAHLEAKKTELRNYITQCMMMPNSVYRETGQKDLDTRNLVQVFLKFTLPSFLDEIAEAMTHQFGKRLIDANYSNVEAEDYPRFRWRFVTPNDLRLVQGLLNLILPHIHTDKLGEVIADYLPGFEREYIAREHKDSVGVQRPAPQKQEGTSGDGSPPPKEEGEDRERTDGQTESVGQAVGTDS